MSGVKSKFMNTGLASEFADVAHLYDDFLLRMIDSDLDVQNKQKILETVRQRAMEEKEFIDRLNGLLKKTTPTKK